MVGWEAERAGEARAAAIAGAATAGARAVADLVVGWELVDSAVG